MSMHTKQGRHLFCASVSRFAVAALWTSNIVDHAIVTVVRSVLRRSCYSAAWILRSPGARQGPRRPTDLRVCRSTACSRQRRSPGDGQFAEEWRREGDCANAEDKFRYGVADPEEKRQDHRSITEVFRRVTAAGRVLAQGTIYSLTRSSRLALRPQAPMRIVAPQRYGLPMTAVRPVDAARTVHDGAQDRAWSWAPRHMVHRRYPAQLARIRRGEEGAPDRLRQADHISSRNQRAF